MQLIAEAYDLLRTGLGADPARIAEIFRTWNEGDLESFLIEITADVLAHTDASDRPAVHRHRAGPGRAEGHRPLDRAERAGPGHPDHRHRRGDVRPVAVRARRAARPPPARPSAARPAQLDGADPDAFAEQVRRALYASKVVAYAQGFDQIAAGSAEYDWDIDRGAMATIWRGGCIIRARFLDRIREAYDSRTDLPQPAGRALLRRGGPATGVDAWRHGGGPGGPGRHPHARVLLLAGLLRRAAPGPAARRADPGPAGQLRRPHLPAGRPRGRVPHRVGGRPAAEHPA